LQAAAVAEVVMVEPRAAEVVRVVYAQLLTILAVEEL
jgi:hypothetical protein